MIAATEIHLIPDKTAFIQFAIFLIVLFGLSFLIFKPFKKIILARKEKMEGLLEEVRGLEDEIKKKSSEYEERINKAREEAYQARDKLRHIGQDEETIIKNKARKDAVSILEEARKEIESAKIKAIGEIEKDIPSLADKIVKKIKG